MRLPTLVAAAAVAALLPASAALAQSTTQEVLALCSERDAAKKNFCYGFVRGVADSAQDLHDLWFVPLRGGPGLCVPADASNGRLVALWEEFVRLNPARRKAPPVGTLIETLAAAYPCRPNGR